MGSWGHGLLGSDLGSWGQTWEAVQEFPLEIHKSLPLNDLRISSLIKVVSLLAKTYGKKRRILGQPPSSRMPVESMSPLSRNEAASIDRSRHDPPLRSRSQGWMKMFRLPCRASRKGSSRGLPRTSRIARCRQGGAISRRKPPPPAPSSLPPVAPLRRAALYHSSTRAELIPK